MLLLLACTTSPPPAADAPLPEPVATAPTAETLAAAAALHSEVAEVNAAFAAALPDRATCPVTTAPCAAVLDPTRPAVWVTDQEPGVPPGVDAAAQLLHAVDPNAYAAPSAVAASGVAEVDFERVRRELASTRVFYWETEGTPPVLDEAATAAPGERIFTGGRSKGEAWVWDGAARRFVCRTELTVANTAPIVTREGEKVAWDIRLAVTAETAAHAVAIDAPPR